MGLSSQIELTNGTYQWNLQVELAKLNPQREEKETMARVRCEYVIPYSREKTFELLANINQLPLLLEEVVDVEVVDGEDELAKGATYALVMTRFGISQEIHWEVSEVIAGTQVIYHQLEGVFSHWEHKISFEDDPRGVGTKVVDCVEYEMPFGFLGLVANDLIVRRELRSLLLSRLHKAAKQLAAGEKEQEEEKKEEPQAELQEELQKDSQVELQEESREELQEEQKNGHEEH